MHAVNGSETAWRQRLVWCGLCRADYAAGVNGRRGWIGIECAADALSALERRRIFECVHGDHHLRGRTAWLPNPVALKPSSLLAFWALVIDAGLIALLLWTSDRGARVSQ